MASDVVELRLHPGPGRTWMNPGGEMDDDALTLYIATFGAEGGGQYEVRVPMIVAPDGGLKIGRIKVTQV